MQKLGFQKKWIERVMTCVTTTSFSILLSGKPYGNVLPIGKSGFISPTKHIAEATNMDLFHS